MFWNPFSSKRFEKKVDYFIIGAQKAGTTSLHYYLSQLDIFAPSKNKEVNFFSYDKNYKQGIEHYHRNFDFELGTLAVDATPEYMYFPFVAKRIYDYNPNAKLIVCLRNPIYRAYSAWKMYLSFQSEIRGPVLKLIEDANIDFKEGIENFIYDSNYLSVDFDEVIGQEMRFIKTEFSPIEPSFIRRGVYVDQIKNYLKYFEIDQFFFVNLEELEASPLNVIKKILHGSGIDVVTYKNIDFSKQHVRKYKIEIGSNCLTKLNKFYKAKNEELFSLIGQRFDWNSSL